MTRPDDPHEPAPALTDDPMGLFDHGAPDLQLGADDVFDPDAPAPSTHRPTGVVAPVERPAAAAPAPALQLENEPGRRHSHEENLLLEQAIHRADRHADPGAQAPDGPRFYRDPEILAEEVGDRREPVAMILSCVLLVVVAGFGFLAWKNEGVLDLRNTTGAFAPLTTPAPVLAAPQQHLAVRIAGPEEPPRLTVVSPEVGIRRSPHWPALLVAEGAVVHEGGAAVRRVMLEVEVRSAQGERIAVREFPAGGTLGEDDLAAATDEDALDERIDALARRAASLEFGGGQRTPFAAVFPLDAPVRPHRVEVSARIVSLEVRNEAGCWEVALPVDDSADALPPPVGDPP